MSPFFENLIIEFVAEVIIAILLAFGGYIFYILKIKPYKLSRILGIVETFKNQDKAKKDMLREFRSSSSLRVFTMRGDTFTKTGNGNNIADAVLSNTNLHQNYIISNADNPFVEDRGKELIEIKKFVSIEAFRNDLKSSLNILETAKKQNTNIDFCSHMEIVRERIILIDDFLYLSFIDNKTPTKNTPVLKICKQSSIYSSYSAFFEDNWKKYKK